MGFAENGPGFVILDHKTNKVFHSDSVRVHDNKACSQQQQVEDANVVDAVDKEVTYEPGLPQHGRVEEPAILDQQLDHINDEVPVPAPETTERPQELQPQEEQNMTVSPSDASTAISNDRQCSHASKRSRSER